MMELISEEINFRNQPWSAVTLLYRWEFSIDQNGTVFEFGVTRIDLSTGIGYSVGYGN